MDNGFAKYVVNPDKSVTYDIIQAYVHEHLPKVPLPLLANWKETLTELPDSLVYGHMYEYLMKRTAVVLAADGEVTGTYDLPVADKPLTKGYNFYGSGHIQEIKVNVTDDYCHVWSRVMASMKDQIYLCKIILEKKSSVVLKGECECVAGRGGKCNHIAAVLFALVEYRESQRTVSCTALAQQWHLPSRKGKKESRPQKIGERVLTKHVFGSEKKRKQPLDGYDDYQAISNPVINLQELKESEQEVDHKMGLHFILVSTDPSSDEAMETTTSNLTPEEIVNSELQVTSSEQADIERETVEQHAGLAWYRQRKGRITASVCKDFCGRANPARLIKKVITVGSPNSAPKSKHMVYGIENEDRAVEKFVNQLQEQGITVDIRKCGLYVSLKNGVLAASPDRMGKCGSENVIVEVKCLSASRDLTPVEAAQQKQKDSNFGFRESNGHLVMKENHKYHYQVQMQMAVTNIHVCFVVVFTNSSVPVEIIKVNFDSDFWQDVEEKLVDFHATHIMPALVLQRFGHQD